MTALSSSSRVRDLEHLEARRRHQLFENRAIEHGAAAHRVGLEPHQVVLEQPEEEVLQQRAEMRHQPLARLDQFARSSARSGRVPLHARRS